MTPKFSVTTLDHNADRSEFDCGASSLDRYFKTLVTQDIKRRICACFVACSEPGKIAGFYTLASASVALSDLPKNIIHKLPRYPSVPAVRMGRLAVTRTFQGQGLGSALLADGLKRCAGAEISAYALIVDAKDKPAAKFYSHHGFFPLKDQPLSFFLPLDSIRSVIG